MMNGLTPIQLAISAIAVGERIGFFSASHAERLGQSMAADGQHAPIQVRRNGNAAKLPWTLVAGLHRLRGAEAQGWAEIAAIQVADKSATPADLRRLELAENLSHMVRRPIERAIMMAEYARLEEEIDHPGHVGESRHARAARVTNSATVTITEAPSYLQRTACAFDVSLSLLEKYRRIYRAIAGDLSGLAEQVNAHPLGESFSAMTTIAQIKAIELRTKAAEKLLERDDWPNMQGVLVAAGIADSTGKRPEKTPAAAMDLWNKLTRNGQRAHAEWIAEKVDATTANNMVATMKRRGLLP
jgi:ParB family chromosome partitioning protein